MARYTIERGYKKKSVKGNPKAALIFIAFIISLVTVGLHYPIGSKETPVSEKVSALPQESLKITEPLPWPTYGQAAYGVNGDGVLAVSDDTSKPVPMASLAKVITALAIMQEKPLKAGEEGPLITFTDEDVSSYNDYLAKDGSVTLVEVNKQMTQRQAMQAMLMQSSNNMADTLARWAFGSIDNYSNYANKMLNELGMTQTAVGDDASGFSPKNISTAHELTQLGLAYMKNPVLAEIAKSPDLTLPVAGPVRNYNSVANKEGLVGVKVGNTDEAGRCFIMANVRGDTISVVTVLGADHLATAIADAEKLLSVGDKAYDQLPKSN